MIPERLHIKGFLSFLDETINFDAVSIALICGENGEGKSSLLDAIIFCGWGEGRGSKFSDFINDDCDTLRIEYIFKMENVRYKKIRQYGEDGNLNELYIDSSNDTIENAVWRLISDDNKKATDDSFSEILGMNAELYLNTAFFGQKESAKIVTGGPQERKDFICKLLDVPFYKEAEKNANDKASDIDSKISVKLASIREKESRLSQKDSVKSQIEKLENQKILIESQIETINSSISEKEAELKDVEKKINDRKSDEKLLTEIDFQISQNRSQIFQCEKDIKNSEVMLDRIIDDGTKTISEIEQFIANKDEQNKKLDELNAEILTLSKEKDKIASLRASNSALLSEKEVADKKMSALQTQLKEFDKKIKRIEESGALCPVIGHQCDLLDDSNKVKTIDEIRLEQNEMLVELKSVQSELVDIRSKLTDCEHMITRTNERLRKESSLQVKVENILKTLTSISESEEKLPLKKEEFRKRFNDQEAHKNDLETRLVDYKKSLIDKEKEKENLLETLSSSNELSTQFQKVLRSLGALKEDLSSLSKEEKQLIMKIGQCQSQLEEFSLLESDVNVIKEQIEELKISHRAYTELAFAFGKNGIQKEIISGVIPILEAQSNELLAMFRKDHKVKIKFDLDPVTAKGTAKKSGGLDIIVTEVGKKPRILNMYSGGETVRIVFAILLSVSNLLTTRAGKKNETLIIDERIAALDEKGIEQFIEIIRHISSNFKKILIVSHIEKLKQSFNQQLLIKKHDGKGSKVTFISC